MKNILIVLGGGRPKGNTRQLADAFAQGARDAGHQVEIVSLNQVEVRGCTGCNACRYGKPCVQKDGFNDLVPKIKAADLLVFASPLLFWTLSSKIKAFIERFYCLAEKDENPPCGRYEKYPVKDAALLMTSADDYFWTYEQAVSYYQCRHSLYRVSRQGHGAGGRLRGHQWKALHQPDRPPENGLRVWKKSLPMSVFLIGIE